MAISSNKRITILNPSEIDQLYRLPQFTTAERTEYFTLTDEEEAIVARFRSLETKAYFILLLGYFRVKPMIVHFRFRDVRDDLHHMGSKPYSSDGREHAAKIIRSAAHTMSDPADLINAAVEGLVKANIELPAFSALDRLAGHIRQKVHEELYTRITDALAPEQQEILEGLLVVAPDDQFTPFNQLKQTPGTPTLGHVRLWAEHLHRIEAILDPAPFLVDIAHTKIRQFRGRLIRLGD